MDLSNNNFEDAILKITVLLNIYGKLLSTALFEEVQYMTQRLINIMKVFSGLNCLPYLF
jgi:hypothetical protein